MQELIVTIIEGSGFRGDYLTFYYGEELFYHDRWFAGETPNPWFDILKKLSEKVGAFQINKIEPSVVFLNAMHPDMPQTLSEYLIKTK